MELDVIAVLSKRNYSQIRQEFGGNYKNLSCPKTQYIVWYDILGPSKNSFAFSVQPILLV